MIDKLQNESYLRAYDALAVRNSKVTLTGLFGAASAHFVYSFASKKANKNKCVYVAENELNARKIAGDLAFFAENPDEILYLKPAEYMLYDVEARSSENANERVRILYRLLKGDWKILVISAITMTQWLPEPSRIKNSAREIAPGMISEPSDIAKYLASIGYTRVSQIDGLGQYSIRGDIMDIYPYGSPVPVRIEFFDNEIDTVRAFDLLSQRTTFNVGKAVILPDRETYIWDESQLLKVRTMLKKELVCLDSSSMTAVRLTKDIEKLAIMKQFAGYDRYLPYILENKWTIFDYVGRTTVFFEPESNVSETIRLNNEEFQDICEAIDTSSGLPEKTVNIYSDYRSMYNCAVDKAYGIAFINEFGGDEVIPGTVHFNCISSDPSGDNKDQFIKNIEKWYRQNFEILILLDSEGKTKRLESLLEDNKLPFITLKWNDVSNFTFKNGGICLTQGGLSSGFVYPDEKIAIVSDGSLFKREKARAKKKLKGQAITSFADIQPGDYVVHDVHGIGIFQCIESVEIDGIRRDYIKIAYKDNGVLFVPTHQLDSVEKFIGSEGQTPKVNKLGGADWSKTTSKVKENLRVYAKELVELYAKRSKIKGFACEPDNVWQAEFEESFEFDETEDQLRCVEEIKSDMESERPMERLLCGDVGYGKTEVALRAAFKAVCNGKQVAFLAPTTVLAQQHYQTFVKRLENFPVTVDYLCRFRTPSQRKKIIERTAAGKIDILIGTHAIIKDGVKFKDLGLAVIDEEQRFGVLHKEKFKQDHPNVDILSLSATPIPRTLHMSLSGIRDISVIEDPPKDRLPVQTYVAEWDPHMIKNAIYRELARRGQVFYLYNRVQSMPEKLRQLRELVPEARIGAAHGQMSERELEDIMQQFVDGEFDILLCTTIVESGLDMPNVNTIIVEDSDRMGLSQLYQIRGRVGRAGRLAYAYITYKKDKNLTEIAEKRLRTIRDFTEFGSGFKIALRDLEIRGAGSVLGERQHGQLSVVGYETYCRLLADVVTEEQTGEEVVHKPETSVECRISAYIDSEYIENEEARLDIYQKIARVETDEDELEITDELIDRYGSVPASVKNLILVSKIRHAAENCGFTSVIQKPTCVVFIIAPDGGLFKTVNPLDASYIDFTRKYGRDLVVNLVAKTPSITLYQKPGTDAESSLKNCLDFLRGFSKLGS